MQNIMSLDGILTISLMSPKINYYIFPDARALNGFLKNCFRNFLDPINILFDPQNCLNNFVVKSFQLFQLLLLGKKDQAHDNSLHAYQIASHTQITFLWKPN